jgi:hypothetical protein
VALLLSILFEGLELDLPIIAGTALVLAGNVFVLAGKSRMPKNPATPGHVVLPANSRGQAD